VRNVEAIEVDLDQGALPKLDADGAWCRWVFAFLNRSRDLLKAIHGALKPGATLVVPRTRWIPTSDPRGQVFVRVTCTRRAGPSTTTTENGFGWEGGTS
jgi:hypothetical protein